MELGAKGYIPKTDAWCEHAFTQVMMPCNNTSHRLRDLFVSTHGDLLSLPQLRLFFRPDMQPNSTATEVSAHLSEVSPDPSTNMPGSQTTATATSARDNLPAPRRPQPIFSATYMHKQLPTTFSIHAHMHFQRNIYSTAQLIHGLNIYCPAPRIAGYQSPFPFVCASWTGVSHLATASCILRQDCHRTTDGATMAVLQSCNISQKQSHRYHFLYGHPRAGGSERASFTAFPLHYHSISNICAHACAICYIIIYTLSYIYLLISFIICRSRGDVETSSLSLEILLQAFKATQTGRMGCSDVLHRAKEHKKKRCLYSGVHIFHTVKKGGCGNSFSLEILLQAFKVNRFRTIEHRLKCRSGEEHGSEVRIMKKNLIYSILFF
eukprot:30278_5